MVYEQYRGFMLNTLDYSIYYYDTLALALTLLVVFIGSIVTYFSVTYMRGDTHYKLFLARLVTLIVMVAMMVAADHWLLLLATWGLSNHLLCG